MSFKKIINSLKLIFFNINWLNDLKVGCKSPFYLVELITLEFKQLQELKGSLEWDEVVNM